MSIINNHLSIIRGEVLFLNIMKKQNTAFTFNFYLFTLPALWDAPFAIPSGYSSCLLCLFVAKKCSIKNNKLCETKPISEMPKMFITSIKTTNYNELLTMNCYSKQTQTNPNEPKFTRRSISEGGQSQILGFLTFRLFLIIGQLAIADYTD